VVRQIQHGRLCRRGLIADFQPVTAAECISQIDGQLARETILAVSRNILQRQGTVRLAFQRPYMVGKARVASMRGHALAILLQRVLYPIQRKLGPFNTTHIATYRSPIVLTEPPVVAHIVKSRHAVPSLIQ